MLNIKKKEFVKEKNELKRQIKDDINILYKIYNKLKSQIKIKKY